MNLLPHNKPGSALYLKFVDNYYCSQNQYGVYNFSDLGKNVFSMNETNKWINVAAVTELKYSTAYPESILNNSFDLNKLIVLEVDDNDIVYQEENEFRVKSARRIGDIEQFPVFFNIMIQQPNWAYYYASYIDRQPSDITRKGVLSSADYSLWYAKFIDKKPHDDTRLACMECPRTVYLYALYVDQTPNDVSRNIILNFDDIEYIYDYAINIDKQPRDDTRRVVAKYHRYAFDYMKYFNEAPSDYYNKLFLNVPYWENKYKEYMENYNPLRPS